MSKADLAKLGFIIPNLNKEQALSILRILQEMRPFAAEDLPEYEKRHYPKSLITSRWSTVELTANECSDFLKYCAESGLSTDDWGMDTVDERVPAGESVKLELGHIFDVACPRTRRAARPRAPAASRG